MTPITPSASARFRFHWGHGVVLVFVAWVSLMLSFLASAIFGGTDSLQDDRPYERGLAYEQRLTLLRHTQGASGRLTVRLSADHGALNVSGTAGAVGQLRLMRPGNASRDLRFAIDLRADTVASLALPPGTTGHWRTELSYTRAGQQYLTVGELFIPAKL
jgi:hypothetical protein